MDPPSLSSPLDPRPVGRDAWASSPPRAPQRWLLASALLGATFFFTTTLGAVWFLITRTDRLTDLGGVFFLVTPRMVREVWSQPDLVLMGLSYSIPTLIILLSHELGHYLTCRAYGLPATLPYFLPAPFGLGTLGAFIRIYAPLRSKRELFDVGISGPLAGFAALLPFLWVGTALSKVEPVSSVPLSEATSLLVVPGRSLALNLVARGIHGPIAPGSELVLHPIALAAWLGMLVTALNLFPLGQLDGGHILYAVVGSYQRRIALPLWLAVLVVGWYGWRGLWLWAGIIWLMGIKHPRIVNEGEPLGRGRVALAFLAAALFVLCLCPEPLRLVPVP